MSRTKLHTINQRKLAKAVEYSPASIVITDKDGNIEYVNPSFTQITGFKPEEVEGKNPSVLQSGLTPHEVYEELWSEILSNRVWRGQFINKKSNGELYWEDAWIAPITDDSGEITHFVAIKEDITERVMIEKDLKETNRDLALYSSLLHHDITNDLQIIITQIELMKGQLSEGNEIVQDLVALESAATRMTMLLQTLSSYQAPEDDDIQSIVRRQADLAEATHKDLTVNVSATPDIKDVRVQGLALLPVVFDNLLRNSAQHGGSCTEVSIVLSIENSSIIFDFSDNGPGIDPMMKDKLFTRGVSTGNGGLGLYLCKRIIEGYDGTIELNETQAKDTGASFRIMLPVIHIKKTD